MTTLATILLSIAFALFYIATIIALVLIICHFVAKRKVRKATKKDDTPDNPVDPEKDDKTDDTNTDENGEGTSDASEEVKPCVCTEAGALELAEDNADRLDKIEARHSAEDQNKRLEKNAKDIQLVEDSLGDNFVELVKEQNRMKRLKNKLDKYEEAADKADEAVKTAESEMNACRAEFVDCNDEAGNADLGISDKTVDGADADALETAGSVATAAEEEKAEARAKYQAARDTYNIMGKAAKAANDEVDKVNEKIKAKAERIVALKEKLRKDLESYKELTGNDYPEKATIEASLNA